MQIDLATDFSRYAAAKLRTELAQIVRCVKLLTPDELWRRHNAHTNSVGNLVLHLTGNVRQWILGGIAGEAIQRDRNAEFAARDVLPAERFLPEFETVIEQAIAVIEHAAADALQRQYSIQRYAVTGMVAIFHVVEHFSFHTGQIVHITKIWRDCDLSLYDAGGQRIEQSSHPIP